MPQKGYFACILGSVYNLKVEKTEYKNELYVLEDLVYSRNMSSWQSADIVRDSHANINHPLEFQVTWADSQITRSKAL